MTVIGVVGRAGSGKSELTSYLEDKAGARKVSLEEVVLRDRSVEGRDELIETYADIVKEKGDDFAAREVIGQLDEQPCDVCAIDGIRTTAEVERLRQEFGDQFVLVRVDVSHPQARIERLVEEESRGKPETMDELLGQDKREDKLLGLSRTMGLADITVNNDGTMGAFHRNIEEELLHSDNLSGE